MRSLGRASQLVLATIISTFSLTVVFSTVLFARDEFLTPYLCLKTVTCIFHPISSAILRDAGLVLEPKHSVSYLSESCCCALAVW